VSRVKPAQVRFYIDADLLGLAHVLVKLRSDVTYPGDQGGVVHMRERPPCPITSPDTFDDVWIPTVTLQGWLIITRDSKIQIHRREITAVRDHGARMVTIVGDEPRGTFAQLEILMSQWRRIEACLDEDGPFIYAASRTAFRSIPLV
jgi:PIN like domain